MECKALKNAKKQSRAKIFNLEVNMLMNRTVPWGIHDFVLHLMKPDACAPVSRLRLAIGFCRAEHAYALFSSRRAQE